MIPEFKVIIVGSGLGGLSLAQSPRRAGIAFQLFEKGTRLLTKDDLGTGVWPSAEPDTPVHANVDRAILRQILLTGLTRFNPFQKELERYESTGSNNVTAYFADGTTATGSCLIGADGVNSRVGVQRAPELRTMDAGITAIYGRLPISAVFLGLGSVIFPTPPDEAAKKLEGEAHLPSRESYAVCIIGGRHEHFPDNTRTATTAELQVVATGLLGGWSVNAASLVSAGDPDSFFAVHMRTSVPNTLKKPTNVTLLGDAVHSMTPSLGRGANLAMRHGALLGRHLKNVAGGDGNLADELAEYDESMLDYGFKTVREAAKTSPTADESELIKFAN